MIKLSLVLSGCLFTTSLLAQGINFRGRVLDSLTREPLEYAMIRNLRSGKKAITDKQGSFSLAGTRGDTLEVSDMCYITRMIIPAVTEPIQIGLVKSTIMLKDVTVGQGYRLETYKTLSSLDLNRQPVKSAQDLLRLIPGLFIAQHMGGGKAEQIFIRGFDADHGTDVNITVDGLPVNMVTHAHGQGYADMHFLIPETVGSYDFGKGPYYTEKGDFTTAGFVSYNTKSALTQNMIKLEAGRYNSFRGVVLLDLLGNQAKKIGQNAYIAAEGLFSDGGPFKLPENFTRYNLFGKFNTALGKRNNLTFIASAFRSKWRASGDIPDRAISEGIVDSRFGVIDSAQGGQTRRTNISTKMTSDIGNGWSMENQIWYTHYAFELTNNVTFNYYFPLEGDEFHQQERRDEGGYNGKAMNMITLGDLTLISIGGLGLRDDRISPLQTTHTEDGKFLNFLQSGSARERNMNVFVEENLQTGHWLWSAGLRLDNFYFNYLNLLSTEGSGTVDKAVISPKINIAYNFNKDLQVYLKAAKGFHSNDARVVVAKRGLSVIPAAYGIDLGINWKPVPNLFINSAFWYLYLQQEFRFGQDLSDLVEGPISPSGRTVRLGLDLSARYQINRWLFANLNANIARPRALDSLKGHDRIDLAPTFTSTAGLNFKLKDGINGGISYRYLANRAANSDYSLTARGYFITDLALNYTQKRYEVGVSVENLFNRTWDESQIAFTSRFKDEAKAQEQVSYTPGVPLFAKLKVSLFF